MQLNPERLTFSMYRGFCNSNRVWTPEEVEARVIRIVKSSPKCKKADSLTPDSKFRELGFDSLDVVDLVTALEDSFAVHLKNSEVEKIQTVREAVALFQQYKIPPKTDVTKASTDQPAKAPEKDKS